MTRGILPMKNCRVFAQRALSQGQMMYGRGAQGPRISDPRDHG